MDPAAESRRLGPLRWPRAVLGSIAMLLALAGSISGSQGLPEAWNVRLRNLVKMSGQEAARECGSLLKPIDETLRLTPFQRAEGLDRLRDTCSRKLSWTDPLLGRIAERAVARRRPLESAEPAALCKALRVLGLSHHYRTHVARAHALYEEAVAVSRRWRGRGTTDEDVAASLESVSGSLLELRRFPEALERIQESLRLRRRAVPPLPEKVVSALAMRARIEMRLDLRRAKATLLEAYRLSRDLGPEHSSETTRVASNLGEILYRLGELPQAITLLQEAERRRLHDLSLGRPARQIAATQLLLGQAFFDLGDYPKAIEYHRKAVRGHREWLGKDPYRYGDALTGLASVLEESGHWDEALELQQEALRIREEAAQGRPSAELQLMLARSLTRLGALQQRMGDLKARSTLERALAIEDSMLPERASADRVQTLLELSRHWQETGGVRQARALIDRSLAELALLGEKGPLLFEVQEMAAKVAASPASGLEALKTAGELAARLYGRHSPRMASVFQAQAELQQRQGHAAGALSAALAAQRLSLPHVRAIVQAFPRDQALAFAADRRKSLDLALHLVAENPGLKVAMADETWQVAASSRMLVRDAEIDRQRLSLLTADPELELAAKRLASARERFAYLLVQTQGSFETRGNQLAEARRQMLQAEEALAAKARRFLGSGSAAPVSVEQLRRSLPPGASLVAFFQYQTPGTHAYLAFVLKGSGRVRVVVLGEVATIDWLIQQWREALLSPRGGAEVRARSGQALRRAVWDPIEAGLGGAKTVFAVPDGAIHLVQLAALPALNGGYLIEKGWAFHTLTAERDLLAGASARRAGPLLALGGVDYERAVAQSVASAREPVEVLRGGAADHGGECRRAGIPTFSSLPGSREEVRDLARLWQSLPARAARPRPALTTLIGREATEQALRRAVRGQRIVHLATHGFVLRAGCGREDGARVRGIGGLSLGVGTPLVEARPFSGLVLAGANDRGKAFRSDQDGILTEEEILDLDLASADWVVLSACDTGLGRIRPGEGVVGMLRAFQVAGAKTVIVSLWSIEDQAARIWMRELYRARFERGLSTLEAMRQASLHSLLVYRKQGDDNPARWAGFVASGQWN